MEKHLNFVYDFMNLSYISFDHKRLENILASKKSLSLVLLVLLTEENHDLRSVVIAREYKALK